MAEKKTDQHLKVLNHKLDQAEHQLAKLKDELEKSEQARSRITADYHNLEKRLVKEQQELRHRHASDLLEKLFPIFDNLYRASHHAPALTVDDIAKMNEEDLSKIASYFAGLKMIEGQMEQVLAEAGLQRIATQGTHFDPQLHEAVSYEINPDFAPEMVIGEIEAGWLLNGRVVRPAKVRVSQG